MSARLHPMKANTRSQRLAHTLGRGPHCRRARKHEGVVDRGGPRHHRRRDAARAPVATDSAGPARQIGLIHAKPLQPDREGAQDAGGGDAGSQHVPRLLAAQEGTYMYGRVSSRPKPCLGPCPLAWGSRPAGLTCWLAWAMSQPQSCVCSAASSSAWAASGEQATTFESSAHLVRLG